MASNVEVSASSSPLAFHIFHLPLYKSIKPSYLGLVEVAAAAIVQVAERALAADLFKARAEVVRRIEKGRAAADPAVRGLGDDDGGRGEEGRGGGGRRHERDGGEEKEEGREARRRPASHFFFFFFRGGRRRRRRRRRRRVGATV